MHEAIPRLTDLQIIVELMKLLRMVGDGQTGLLGALPGFDEHSDLRQVLPLRFYLFEEGLYVIAGDPEYEGLLDAQVPRFGERSVDEVLRALDPLIGHDNEHRLKETTPNYLRQLPLLHALGPLPEPRRLALTIRERDGQDRTVDLVTDASQPDIWYRASPHPAGWRSFPETLPTPLPLYPKNLGTNYWRYPRACPGWLRAARRRASSCGVAPA